MSNDASLVGPGVDVNVDRVASWLAEVVDPSVSSASLTRLGGHSSGAWRIDAVTSSGTRPMVLKAPSEPSVVYRHDAGREARVLAALGRLGVPVPSLLAVDDGAATGRHCFVMEHVEGRALSDSSSGGPHDDAWLREAGAEAQRAVWDSFHDALASLHSAAAASVPDASLGPRGLVDVLAYWRQALLDAAPAANVPRQLRVLDWLRDNAPPGADDAPAVCMGDARLANCLVAGTEVRALVDFEVAYVGNPAADVAYSVMFEDLHRANTDQPLPGIPTAEQTWARWSRATGRPAHDRDYWTAFATTVLCVTATRAMIQWGLAGPGVEADNPVVVRWEAAVARAAQ